MRELWIWDKVLVASEVRKVSEKSWGTNGLMPTPPTEGCCLNPGVFGELKPQCWLAETILSGLISSISQWRVPHPMFSPFVVLWLVSSPNLSHCERAVFIMKGFSPSLSPSLSCSLAPTPILSPLCSALFAAAEVLLQDLSIDTTWCPPWLYNVLKPISVNFLNLELDRFILECVCRPCLMNVNNICKHTVVGNSE